MRFKDLKIQSEQKGRRSMEEGEDPWLGADKLYHMLFCFSLTLLFSTLASHSPYPFLRAHSIRVGSILSLLSGAAKEAADQLGIFPSAGASFRDGVADALGVLVASLLLHQLSSGHARMGFRDLEVGVEIAGTKMEENV